LTGHDVSAGDIVVSTGSKQALFNSCFVLFGGGDEVLVPTPAWTSYYQMLTMARARPVAVRGRRENSLKISASELEEAATPRTRGVMLNSPTNPTGAVYALDELRGILKLAASRGWWVISDEIYREISYEAAAPSLLDAARDDSALRERLVIVDGVAKAYAMTGTVERRAGNLRPAVAYDLQRERSVATRRVMCAHGTGSIGCRNRSDGRGVSSSPRCGGGVASRGPHRFHRAEGSVLPLCSRAAARG